MKKLLYIVAFVSSASTSILGVACNNDLKDACDDFVEYRNSCEALSPPDPEDVPKYMIDMCDNIDPECEAFFQCSMWASCKEDRNDKFRLDYDTLNKDLMKLAMEQGKEFVECREPENKACTDDDLRP